MTTLAAALNSSAQQLRVDAAVADPADFYKIDSEVVQLLSHRQASAAYLAGDPTLWRVERGVAGTTAASHLNGATLTALYPQIALSPVEAPGGGGVSVDNTVDPPFDATTLKSPGAQDAGGGVANLLPVVVSDTDPGAVGAGNIWLHTGMIGGPFKQLLLRNGDDDDWIAISPVFGTDVGETGDGQLQNGSGDSNLTLAPSGGALLGPSITLFAFDGGVKQFLLLPGGFKVLGMPTVDPGLAGYLWNDSGTLKVSAG